MNSEYKKPLNKLVLYELNHYFYINQYRFEYYRPCDINCDYDFATEKVTNYHIFYND